MERRRARLSLLLLIAIAATAAIQAGFGQPSQAAESKELVDINKATATELEQLPGVGPSIALKIVEFREKNGPFQSVDELLKIRGIGEKSLDRFRDLITVGKKKS
jgi:competence protein ComEA